jgi:UDP-glucuronate 4-epimerase
MICAVAGESRHCTGADGGRQKEAAHLAIDCATTYTARMHVLVTGGAGFIGSHLVDSLLRDGCAVTIVDNFDSFYDRAVKEDNIAAHRADPRWRLVEADVRHAQSLESHLTTPYDAIVHLAAKAGVRSSISDPSTYQDVNVAGTQNVLELAKSLRIPQVVFGSSSSVYGINPRVPWSEEDHVLQPISPYASTKVSAELLGHVYSHLYGLRFIALRLFTVYGPRQRPDLAIHKFARLIEQGKPIPVFGDGTTRRDYTFVDDIVNGIRAALRYDRTMYEVINLGNSTTVTLLETIEGLERAMGRKAVIEWLPPQAGDVPQTWANVEKARALLGYRPGVSYPEGVNRFVDWYSSRRCFTA